MPIRKQSANRAAPFSDLTALRIFVAAGGYCCFLGCTKSVMHEVLTKKASRLGHVAHIVAESIDGPRGDHPMPLEQRNQFENLMLMCTEHAAFIDKKDIAPLYPVETLLAFKKAHEERVARQLSIPPDAVTRVLRFRGKIKGNAVSISDAEIPPALYENEKRYADEGVIDIDLNNFEDLNTATYWEMGKDVIDRALNERILPFFDRNKSGRLSVFALARIPLLVYFGIRIGDKIPMSLYQKGKSQEEGWIWPKDGKVIDFKLTKHAPLSSNEKVGFVVSFSGKIDISKVRKAFGDGTLYEIEPIEDVPSRLLLTSPETIDNFRKRYHEFMSLMEKEHTKCEEFGYFLAVPCAIAIVCGRDIQKGTVPRLVIYDKVEEEYLPTITINKDEYDKK